MNRMVHGRLSDSDPVSLHAGRAHNRGLTATVVFSPSRLPSLRPGGLEISQEQQKIVTLLNAASETLLTNQEFCPESRGDQPHTMRSLFIKHSLRMSKVIPTLCKREFEK